MELSSPLALLPSRLVTARPVVVRTLCILGPCSVVTALLGATGRILLLMPLVLNLLLVVDRVVLLVVAKFRWMTRLLAVVIKWRFTVLAPLRQCLMVPDAEWKVLLYRVVTTWPV